MRTNYSEGKHSTKGKTNKNKKTLRLLKASHMPCTKKHKLPEASQNLNSLRYSTKYRQDEQKKNQKGLSHPQWYVRVFNLHFQMIPQVGKAATGGPHKTFVDCEQGTVYHSFTSQCQSPQKKNDNTKIQLQGRESLNGAMVPNLRAINHIVQI